MSNTLRTHDHEALLRCLGEFLTEHVGCHTAILYGSRARGDWDESSDVDVVGFRDGEAPGHVAQIWHGLYLDLFLYPTSALPTADWQRLHGGRVLFQRGSIGTDVLSASNRMLAEAPERLSTHALQTRRLWAEKMLARAAKGDVEGNYRRLWLLTELLQDYFVLRNLRYLGPKESLGRLAQENPSDYNVMRAAFEPSASLEAVRAAVACVIAAPEIGQEENG